MARRGDMGQDGQGLARTNARGSGARAPQCRGHREPSGQDHRGRGPRAWGGGRQENHRTSTTSLGRYVGGGMAILMPRAGLDDGVAAPHLLGHITPHDVPRLETIFADMKDHHHALDAWLAKHRAGWRLAVQTRPEGTQGFTPLETRWVMERTPAWHG